VGKTTLVQKVCEVMVSGGVSLNGFYTEEVRESGRRVGFDVVTVTGERGPLSRVGNEGSVGKREYKVSQYVVDLSSFENLALPLFQNMGEGSRRVFVIDEIGKMELFSQTFIQAVRQALDSSDCILGTIPTPKGKPLGLVEEIRARKDVKVFMNVQPPGSEASSPDWAHLLATQMAALAQQRQEIGEIHSLVQSLGQHVNRLATAPEQRATIPVTSPIQEVMTFSTLAQPLMALLRGQIKPLNWNPKVVKSFEELKNTFSIMPVLQQPDPRKPFVVEVDASDVGVGAVLSQHKEKGGKLYSIAYLSRNLSPAKRNYGVSDHELLAMKLSFEEWRHWLEGARHPFKVITDHKNLEYLQTIKRLNSRQGQWWSFFFSRFNFSVTYRPGERNVRSDALSHQSNQEAQVSCSEPGISELGGLPTVLETADLLFRHVVRQFGLPEDIVSDRGPQFTSQVWKEPLRKLNITVNLTSGYHPERTSTPL
ncbi:hypothetical protein P4O66_013383, partial [Electrophorus voltai]